MKTFRVSISIIILLASLTLVTPAYAAESFCTSHGGTWSGVDADNGTCTYPAGHPDAKEACESNKIPYSVTYVANVETDVSCIRTRTNTRILSSEAPQTSFILRLKGDHNGYVEFFSNSCINSCTIDSVLPDLARNSTIDVPLATVYVRVDGGAGNGSYRVCFENPYAEGLNLYQFIGGNWWLVNFSHSNPVCALATGDGAFYLH